MTREEIINNIRKEGLNMGKNNVLIGIMPTQIQSIALAYHRYENYVPDFFITSLLSAAATAIGNSFRVWKISRIRSAGNCKKCPLKKRSFQRTLCVC